MPHCLLGDGAGFYRLLLQNLLPRSEIGSEPGEGLTPEALALLPVQLAGIFALATAGQCGDAGGVVTVGRAQVLSQLRVGGESLGIKAGRCAVELLVRLLTKLSDGHALAGVGRPDLPF